MSNSNKMYHVVGKLAGFDGISVHPSSMSRIPGFFRWEPEVLTNLTKCFLDSVDGYFIRIKVLNVKKKRQFPLLSKVDDYEVRVFNNSMVGEIVFIDKTGLEDALTFHHIEEAIVGGYYFDEGRNNKINEVIQHLFNTTKKRRTLFKK